MGATSYVSSLCSTFGPVKISSQSSRHCHDEKCEEQNSPKNHPKKKNHEKTAHPLILDPPPKKITTTVSPHITKDNPSPIHPWTGAQLSPASGSWTLEEFKAKRIWPSCGWSHFSKQTGGWKTENFGNHVCIYILYLQIRIIYIYKIYI